MVRIHWGQVAVCGLVAGFVWTLLSIVLLGMLGADLLAAVPGGGLDGRSGGVHLFLLASNFLASIWGIWLYAALRPYYGPGTRSAVVAGVAWWFIVSLQSAKWLAISGISTAVVLPLAMATLVAIVLATLIGARLYEVTGRSARARSPSRAVAD